MKQFFNIGGAERPVLFGRNAQSEIERILGGSFFDGTANVGSISGIRAVVYAGLKWGLYKMDGVEPRPKFTLIEVGEWCEDMGEDSPVHAILNLFRESIAPKSKNVEAGENPA
jgi:hypothetical protein